MNRQLNFKKESGKWDFRKVLVNATLIVFSLFQVYWSSIAIGAAAVAVGVMFGDKAYLDDVAKTAKTMIEEQKATKDNIEIYFTVV